jgi:hypothetical protein
MVPASKGDTSQLAAIWPILSHFTASMPMPTAPKPTMAPMMEWVVDTGQPLHARHHQPHPGGEQRREHAVDQILGVFLEGRGVDDAVADGGGHLAPGNVSAKKLEHHGDQYRLFDGDGLGSHRSAHGVGDVVGANPPGHEKTENAGENEQNQPVIADNFHE